MKNASLDLLRVWGLLHKIIGVVFDTTASNTGVHRGAAILLEQALVETRSTKRLFHLGCRHHVDELLTGVDIICSIYHEINIYIDQQTSNQL